MATTERTRRLLTSFQAMLIDAVGRDPATYDASAASLTADIALAGIDLDAIDRALDGLGPVGEIRHIYGPALGGVRVKYETNSRSTNVEVSVDRPREANETYDDAAAEAVEIGARARKLAFEAIEQPLMSLSIVDGGNRA